MIPTARAGLVVLLLGAVACATAGSGSGEGDLGDAGGQTDSGHVSGDDDSGGSSHDAGNSPPVDASEAQAPQDSGGQVDTGGPQGDSGTCSLTDTSLCSNGAACCFMGGVVSCDCQGGTATQGATCGSAIACAPGYVCGVPSGQTNGTCLAWCVSPSGACGTGTTCMQLIQPSPVVNGVTYGECH
ncbi:MAG TPA: hypothetical protein VIJ22_10305 [Polyangiaceae bacterium]